MRVKNYSISFQRKDVESPKILIVRMIIEKYFLKRQQQFSMNITFQSGCYFGLIDKMNYLNVIDVVYVVQYFSKGNKYCHNIFVFYLSSDITTVSNVSSLHNLLLEKCFVIATNVFNSF